MPTDKPAKPFRHTARERICDALPPESTDPVLAYLHRNAWMYGYGYLPGGSGELESPQQVWEDLAQRTRVVINQLFGSKRDAHRYLTAVAPKWRQPMRNSLKRARSTAPAKIRELHLHMLTHIGTLREHLTDLERELWVLLQLTHDPRLMPRGLSKSSLKHRKQKRRKAIADAKRNRLPVPTPNDVPVVLPARILSMLKDPGKHLN
jgi:hypothetical protein